MAGFIYTGGRVVESIKIRYLESLLSQNMAIFDETGTGDLITQLISDTKVIQDGISHKLALSISALGTLVVTLVVSFVLNWKLTFMLTWSFVLGIGLLLAGNKVAVTYSGQALAAYSSGGSIVEEALGSIKSTIALNMQNEIIKGYDAHLVKAEKAGIILKGLMSLMLSLAIGTGYINVALAFWQGSKMMVHGETNMMNVIAITLITKSAAFCVLGVGHNTEVFTSTAAAASRVFRMIRRRSPIDATSEDGDVPPSLEGRLGFRHVKHIYPSRPGVVVGHDLNFVLAPRTTTAIVGRSGSGKSSVAHLLQRFYDPVEGQISLDGQDIRSLNLRWLRRNMALVTQEPFLFDTSILENILHGLIGTKNEDASAKTKQSLAIAAAKEAQAHDFITQLPQGYATRVGSRGSKLSGGQKQRVAIARALVGDPRILVLDEATSALDPNTEAKVQTALAKSASKRTTLIIAHRLATIRDANNIIVLDRGLVKEQGTHSELMERRQAYFELVRAQVGEASSQPIDYLHKQDRKQFSVVEDASVSEDGDDLGSDSISAEQPQSENAPRGRLWSMIVFVARLNAKEWIWVVSGLLCSVLAGMEESASAIFFGEAIVAISRPGTTPAKIISDSGYWSGMFLMLGFVMILVFGFQGLIFAYCSERLIHTAREMALRAMLIQDMCFFDETRNSPGALATFLSSETIDLAGISGGTLGSILIAISTLVSAFIVSMIYGWKFGLVCSSVIPVLVACGFFGVWITGKFERLTDRYNSESASSASEAISAIHTVAFLTREADVLQTFRESLTAFRRRNLSANLTSSLSYALSQALFYLCMALGFWYGGTRTVALEYSLLQFVVVYSAVIMGAFSAGLVFSFTPNISKAQRAAQNFKTLLETRPSIDLEAHEGLQLDHHKAGTIEFQAVSFAYPTRQQHFALQDVSFVVRPGSHVAFVGATGSGKSTIVSLIERFYDPQKGTILVNGHPISSLNLKDYRQSIGFVNQEPTLYDGSIRENLCAGFDDVEITDDKIHEVCQAAQILDFIVSLP